MPFSMSLSIKKAEWLASPKTRWNKGLVRAGAAWKAENVKYPPAPTGPFGQNRKKSIARQAKYVITSEGLVMELYEVTHWKYAMYGVGVFGPNHTPIVPKQVRFLKVPTPNGFMFLKSVQGYIWSGKLDEIKEAMKKAFAAGIRENEGEE